MKKINKHLLIVTLFVLHQHFLKMIISIGVLVGNYAIPILCLLPNWKEESINLEPIVSTNIWLMNLLVKI